MKYTKNQARMRRRQRIRKKISGNALCPRLVVFRSNAYIYAQLVDDANGHTLASSSSFNLSKDGGVSGFTRDAAMQVGKDLASKAKEKDIHQAVFDRGGYIYHGKIKALADGAREGGLKF
ncbi:50S ribosomal protein L18 [Desulfonatronum lacustre]|uniref:50S ribosomal protein L18 n=1 Tax=Desulfonatronum lacustre TaxID=66849 RepID=UPI00048FA664|nr:50S ribosomal protein L18 [Desulfonatronum lacustre]SMP46833.1 large subunit ribosomal protein L18 [Desulfonatronum zhilinae]